MRRLGLLLSVLCACAETKEPTMTIFGALDGREPKVRVWLRSLGDWESLEVRGKEGLRVVRGDQVRAAPDGFELAREDPPTVLRPIGGVVRVGRHTFAGELVWSDGRLVNRVPMENYVLGVLRGELPLRSVPRAAAAAQAIAVRSYTLHYLAQDREDFDVDDTTLYQRYVGLRYAPDDANLRAGVQATAGTYLAHGGRPLKAYYHSTCGGHTTDVPTGLARDPLAPMGGVPCTFCRQSKYFRWEASIPDDDVLGAAGLAGGLDTVAIAARGPGGRAAKVRVRAAGGAERVVHAGEFRLRLGGSRLRSVRFTSIERGDGAVRFTGAGWGHGVGLCQMGALGQARAGRTGKEIAAYYYPGATLRRAY